jgi:hypothetical protein
LNQTEKDDIFALGTVLYEISVGYRLYPEKSDKEVCKFLQRREFPDITGLGALRVVIEKCWRDQYGSAEEIKYDLGKISQCSRGVLLAKYHVANDCRFQASGPSSHTSMFTSIFWIIVGGAAGIHCNS